MPLFLVIVGFIGFLVSLSCAIWRGFNRDGIRQRSLKWWLLGIAVSFALLAMGLRTFPVPPP